MPLAVAARVARRKRDFYKAISEKVAAAWAGPVTREMALPVAASVRLISACQDNQVALDGLTNGLFTGRLLEAWGEGAFQGDYAAFHRAIVDRMPPQPDAEPLPHRPGEPRLRRAAAVRHLSATPAMVALRDREGQPWRSSTTSLAAVVLGMHRRLPAADERRPRPRHRQPLRRRGDLDRRWRRSGRSAMVAVDRARRHEPRHAGDRALVDLSSPASSARSSSPAAW